MKRVLITGANSYIGVNIDNWLSKSPTAYSVDTIDMIDGSWREKDFGQYDVIIHVAGIAHADVDNISEERKQLYYRVNTDLAIEVAQKAKKEGAGQFILMSSMIIYSGCKEKIITKEDIPIPLNCYGDSKWQADQKVRKLETTEFKVVVLRAPMIYGKTAGEIIRSWQN